MTGNSKRENRDPPPASQRTFFDLWERSENASGGTADMHVGGESDESIVPSTSANKDTAEVSTELIEGRGSANRNAVQAAPARTQGRGKFGSSGLYRVREAARQSRSTRFTAFIDDVTWHDYESNVEANIKSLHDCIHRGAYRAKPSRRTWIPKSNGRQRPLAVTALEDKLVQQAVLWVIQAIYEQDFLGFSYGFRPGRSQHQALDALSVGLIDKKVNWVLDADLESFFDTIDHSWLIKFLEHRIGDRRILRLIRKWLRAGVIEDGVWSPGEEGSPQGSVISPILSNVFLHYVLDLWIAQWRRQPGRGDIVVVRYCDDFVIGFEHEEDAIACLNLLRERFAQFGLKLNDQKTRLIEFGRHATARRKCRGEGRPETFDFLGFTHQCSTTRAHGRFTIRRVSIAKRLRAKLAQIKLKLRQRWSAPLDEVGRWLRNVMRGWTNYHAIPGNWDRLKQFRQGVTRVWLSHLRRSGSQRHRWSWKRMSALVTRYFPRLRIVHPYPHQRFHARLKARAV